jgi:predicted TIM-barrel fold metal-dependent hydrolase
MLRDSHIHLFAKGFQDARPSAGFLDDLSHYQHLIADYSIKQALVVGYEGEPWAEGNNLYISARSKEHSWIAPVAYAKPAALSVELLEELFRQHFVGISLYLFDESDVLHLQKVEVKVWEWLEAKNWVISINSKGERWHVWELILNAHPKLTVLISHLGIPTTSPSPIDPEQILQELKPVLALAMFKNAYLKLSGFYALEKTRPMFPYRSVAPYIEKLVTTFCKSRLIWGSDFPIVLDHVSFTQTYEHLSQLQELNESDLRKVMGENLKDLLTRCERTKQ